MKAFDFEAVKCCTAVVCLQC